MLNLVIQEVGILSRNQYFMSRDFESLIFADEPPSKPLQHESAACTLHN